MRCPTGNASSATHRRGPWALLFTAAIALGACGDKKTADSKPSADTGADVAAAKKLLEAPLAAVASYRDLIDAPSDAYKIRDAVGALAAGEVARASDVKSSGGDALTKGTADALKTLSSACGTDVTKLTMKESSDKIIAARKACQDGLKAFEAALAKLGSDLPKVPKGSPDESAKTALGKLVYGGSAVKAFRDAVAKDSSTIQDVESLGGPAQGEMQSLAKGAATGAPAGGLLESVSSAAPMVFDVEVARLSASGDFCAALKGYSGEPPSAENKASIAEDCAKIEMPKPPPPFMKSCQDLMAKVCH